MIERLALRGTITVMFTDVVGFTSATEERGERTAVRILDAHDRVVLPIVRNHGGRVVKSLGDGVMAAFPDAGEAVAAANEILDGARAAGTRRRGPFRIRVGIDTGRPTRRGDDYIGHSVNVAARLTQRARPGEALVTDAVRRAAVRAGVDGRWKERGAVRLRGVSRPPRAWRLLPPAA
jgi:class 3 adenylate cyclase